jgi:hypothetical protein
MSDINGRHLKLSARVRRLTAAIKAAQNLSRRGPDYGVRDDAQYRSNGLGINAGF